MKISRVVCVLLLLAVTAFAADDPFTGSWKLNIAKSKLLADDKTKSDVYRMVVSDGGMKFTDEVILDGGIRNITVDAKFDGKYYPIKGDPDTDSVAYHRNGNTLMVTLKKGSKVVGKDKLVVSQDGQITTVNFTVFAEEKPLTGTAVYEKQAN
ncbi:MAG TPA: hypothetical protein VH079_17940 [Terriglobales bacterium]|nr:hypothetical protein [Terriglobales bacterium]